MTHHNPSYSITVRLRYPDQPGQLGRITSEIGKLDGQIGAIDIVAVRGDRIVRDVTVDANNAEHGDRLVQHVASMEDVEVIDVSDRTFLLHLGGKIEVTGKVPIKTRDDLSMAYTPGVARVCRAIDAKPESAFALTIRKNMVAVVTDGSAVLGLGNIGPEAALPVMEGKSLLFKEFGGVDAFPICLGTQDVDEIVATVRNLAGTFGGINLEDISAPRCIEIEERLSALLDIPVFHDDQHGTAIVVLAALRNAMKVVGKTMASALIVINGAGAAGTAIAKLLRLVGVQRLIVCDRAGTIYSERAVGMNASKQWIAEHTNQQRRIGSVSDALAGADVLIGVSAANTIQATDLQRMARDPIVFALANPDPEITPEDAAPYVRVMATGRSDYPNQINNVLCFPGFFRGMLDVRATQVTNAMKLAAAEAIAGVIAGEDIRDQYIIPSVFDRQVATVVAAAVSKVAVETGIARRRPPADRTD